MGLWLLLIPAGVALAALTPSRIVGPPSHLNGWPRFRLWRRRRLTMPIAALARDEDGHVAVMLARGLLAVFTVGFVLLGTKYHELDVEKGRGFLTWAWGPWCYVTAGFSALCAIRLRRAPLAIGAAVSAITFWLARIIAVAVAFASGLATDAVVQVGVVLYGFLALLFAYFFYGIITLVGKRRGYHLAEMAHTENRDGD